MTLLAALASHLFAHHAHGNVLEELREGPPSNLDEWGGKPAKIANVLNWAALLGIVLGFSFVIYFAIVNLGGSK